MLLYYFYGIMNRRLTFCLFFYPPCWAISLSLERDLVHEKPQILSKWFQEDTTKSTSNTYAHMFFCNSIPSLWIFIPQQMHSCTRGRTKISCDAKAFYNYNWIIWKAPVSIILCSFVFKVWFSAKMVHECSAV